jgi:hypothetical protein
VVPPRRINPQVPRSLERICLKALAADPAERYASATDQEEALRRFLRRRWVAAAAGFLVVACVALGLLLGPRSPVPAAPLKGDLDLFVWESQSPNPEKFVAAGRRQGLRLHQAVPLSPRDWLRIEARVNRPAYLYLVWIDTEGKSTPIYPWQEAWEKRLPERPRERLSLPERPGDVAPVAPGPAGIETLLLLVRETRLSDAEHAALPALFAGLPWPEAADVRAAAWFENGELLTADREPDRGPVRIGKAQAGGEPVLRLQALLQTQLRPLFGYSRAVCFGNTGK